MRRYRRFTVLTLCLLALACAEHRRATGGPDRPVAPPGLTGTRSGLVLDESRVEDIQAALGPTMVYKTDLGSDTSYMCYVSTFDFALVSFTVERNVMRRLQLLADKHRYSRWDWCTATPLSAEDLTLANGLTLGMKRDDIAALLGGAHRKEGNRWLYAYGGAGPTRKTGAGSVEGLSRQNVRVELEFSNSRLAGIDLQAVGGRLPAID